MKKIECICNISKIVTVFFLARQIVRIKYAVFHNVRHTFYCYILLFCIFTQREFIHLIAN